MRIKTKTLTAATAAGLIVGALAGTNVSEVRAGNLNAPLASTSIASTVLRAPTDSAASSQVPVRAALTATYNPTVTLTALLSRTLPQSKAIQIVLKKQSSLRPNWQPLNAGPERYRRSQISAGAGRRASRQWSSPVDTSDSPTSGAVMAPSAMTAPDSPSTYSPNLGSTCPGIPRIRLMRAHEYLRLKPNPATSCGGQVTWVSIRVMATILPPATLR